MYTHVHACTRAHRAKKYRLISMYLLSTHGVEQRISGKSSNSQFSSSVEAAPMHAGVVFVVLYDEQVHMSDVWKSKVLYAFA